MSTLELMKNIGKIAEWGDGSGLKYDVKITDSRLRWGSVDYLVTPVAGSGARWVSGDSVGLKS
jgi:hypothetical protein